MKNGRAATTPGNILVDIVVKSRCPPPVFHLAKLYAAGKAMISTKAVLPILMIRVFSSDWKKGKAVNNLLKFSSVGVNTICFISCPVIISSADLKAVR
jgi:hypothetical protein